MKKFSFHFFLITTVVLGFIQCNDPSEVNPVSEEVFLSPSLELVETNATARAALVRATVILEANADGIFVANLAETFCHPTDGELSIDWKLYGAPQGSTGLGKLLELKTTEGMTCAEGIAFDYQNAEPMTLKVLVTIYDLDTNALLGYGLSNTHTAP